MGSKTMRTRNIRRNKATKAGSKRKNRNNNHGSTPAFAIHTSEEKK